jgi:DNA-binding response OmpR family regulator
LLVEDAKATNMTAKVLLIDDDPELGKLVDIVLHPIGITLYQSYSGLEGLRNVYALQPDLVIVDIMMPEMDGFEVCRRIREMADMPILVLTARTSDSDMLQGFSVGADDFIKKPFNKNELEVRVRALLRRPSHGPIEGATVCSYSDSVLDIDLSTRTVKLCGEIIRLSPREYGLLSYLVGMQGRVATYDELMQDVWGEPQINAASLVALYVFYLRKKLQDGHHGHQYIRTNWGKGYWFEARREREVARLPEDANAFRAAT